MVDFGADRGAAFEIDAEVQPDHRPDHQCEMVSSDRTAKGQLLVFEEIEIGLFGCQSQTHVIALSIPELSWDDARRTRTR